MCVCVSGVVPVCLCVCVWCVVLARSVYVCVSYMECEVGVDLLERVSVVLGRSAGVCVCLVSCMFACVYVAECVVSDRSVCVCVWCVVLARSFYVCVWYAECRVAVDLLERVSVWCWRGLSVCVSYEE